MSISSTVARNNYVGSNTTATYQYTFKINQPTDLRVLARSVAGVQTTLFINTDYTVTGVGNKAGGSIVLTAGSLANGVHLTIRRVLPLVQNTDIRNQGDFYPETIEDAFDYLTRLDQQQQDHLDRAITLPQTYTAADFNPTIPSALIGSGSVVLATNPTGTALQVGPTLADITTAISLVPQVTSAVVTTAAAVTATAASATQSATSATQSANSATASQNSANLSQGYANTSQTQANNSATSASLSQAQVQLAKDWATKTTGIVDSTDYSAKYYAQLVSSSLSSKVSRAGDTMTGDLALQSILRMELQATSASGSALTFSPTRSNFKFQAKVDSIKAITPPNTPNGALIVLTNDSGYPSAVLNQQGVASDGIITGTGADLLFPNQTTLMLFYDAQTARWRVVGGSAAAGGASIPSGGFTGDVLSKSSNIDGDIAWLTLSKYNIGLGNVDDTADGDKNVNSAQSAFQLTGINDISHGGTGQSDQQSALNALAGTQLAGTYLRSDGTNVSLQALQKLDIPTLNQNTTGNAATATTAGNVTGTVAIANGGTGKTTQSQALTALAGAQSSGKYLRSDGTNTTLSSIVAADVPTLNQNTTGNAATATTANTANTATTAGNVTGTVAIANGGTGQTTRAAALTALAGTQTAGQYLRSDGTNTSLSGIQAADVPTLNQNTTGNAATATTANTATTAGNVTGTVAIANGGTGATSQAAALTALAGTQSSGKYLRSDGTNTALANIVAADVPNLVANTSKLTNVVAPTGAKAFEISSTTGGFKLPDMTSTQRDALTSPVAGTQIYNNSTNKVQFYNASAWTDLAAATATLLNVTNVTAAYTVTTANDVLLCSGSSGYTVTLPTAVGNTGKIFYFKKTDTTSSIFTIATSSSQTIDGVSTLKLPYAYALVNLVSDGANWFSTTNEIPVTASYWLGTTTSFGADAAITYGSKEFDSHSAWSGSVWTAPVRGIYQFALAGGSPNAVTAFRLWKNGTAYKNFASNASSGQSTGSAIIGLAATEQVDIRSTAAVQMTGGASLATTGVATLSIIRVGNY